MVKYKPNRRYYSLTPAEAASVAAKVAKLEGTFDWSTFNDWNQRYAKVQQRRQAKEMVFFEQLPLFKTD